MKFESFYSSSKGNLYRVTADNGQQLLIECGVTWKRLSQAIEYDLSHIEGCLLSHEHKDHSQSVESLLFNGIPVYSSAGTLEACGVLGTRKAISMAPRWIYGNKRDTFRFMAYPSNHDAADPYLFTIKCDDEQILFATDTSHITQRSSVPFDIIAIECSYDKDILQARLDAGKVTESLAKRLLSSHMEKQTAKKYLAKYCNLSKCREIHLLHMSAENIDREETIKEFEAAFFIKTV